MTAGEHRSVAPSHQQEPFSFRNEDQRMYWDTYALASTDNVIMVYNTTRKDRSHFERTHWSQFRFQTNNQPL